VGRVEEGADWLVLDQECDRGFCLSCSGPQGGVCGVGQSIRDTKDTEKKTGVQSDGVQM